MARALKGQLTIPVPNRIGFAADPEKLYAEKYGAEKLAEQKQLYEEERRCTCTPPEDPDKPFFPDKWGVKFGHKSPCPRSGRRF